MEFSGLALVPSSGGARKKVVMSNTRICINFIFLYDFYYTYKCFYQNVV
jgi:hypothetical protein